MISQALTFILLILTSIFLMAMAHRRTKDARLVAILIAAAVARVAVGLLNVGFGPLPGAEVDAVTYHNHAAHIADTFQRTGDFIFESGRLGYSSLLGIFFLLGSPHPLLPTFVNLVLMIHFVLLVYLIAETATEGDRKRALFAAAGAALYPTSILYTAVPLREAVIMWAMALWVYGLTRYMKGRGNLFGWRIIVGASIATWVHSGFVILAVLLPVVWWINGIRGSPPSRKAIGRGFARAVGLLLFAIVLMGALIRVSPTLEKLPDRPGQLTSLEYIDQLRGRKASYGTGYYADVPSSGPNFVLSLPLLTYRFLFSPTPIDIARSGSIEEAVKGLDSAGIFVLLLASLMAARREFREGDRRSVLLLGIVLLTLLLAFSIGTANVGIAIRHRSKFVWLMFLLIAIGKRREANEAVQLRRPEIDRVELMLARPSASSE